jgi:hypothetical protein
MVTPVREYVNPFSDVTSVPAAETPAAPVVAPVAPAVEPAPAPTPVVAEAKVETPAEPEVKAELNILPPEPVQRPAQSWENTAEAATSTPAAPAPAFERRPRREDRRDDRRGERRDDRRGERREDRPQDMSSERPIFRPERRDREGQAPRAEGQFPRREERRPQVAAPTASAAPVAPVAEAPKKSTGLLGWLKGLFSSDSAKTDTPAPAQEKRDERPRDGRGRHGGGHRHGGRGGRDRQFRSPNPQASGAPEGPADQEGGRRDGGFRRRRRGGKGRGFRGEGRGGNESGS